MLPGTGSYALWAPFSRLLRDRPGEVRRPFPDAFLHRRSRPIRPCCGPPGQISANPERLLHHRYLPPWTRWNSLHPKEDRNGHDRVDRRLSPASLFRRCSSCLSHCRAFPAREWTNTTGMPPEPLSSTLMPAWPGCRIRTIFSPAKKAQEYPDSSAALSTRSRRPHGACPQHHWKASARPR